MSLQLGPVYERIASHLAAFDFYRRYLSEELSQEEFSDRLEAHRGELEARGLPAEDVSFASRLPADPCLFVDRALADLVDRGVIDTALYDRQAYERHERRMAESFDHGGFSTYIYPEEGRFLFALTDILRPRRVAFLGSYYGFWAFWALPRLAEHGGHATLIDIDPVVNGVAAANLAGFGYRDHARVVTGDAIAYMSDTEELFDLVVIDAETAKDHPSPQLRGKTIYTPLTRASLAKTEPGGVVLFHNILLSHHRADPFFDAVIARNRREYSELLPVLERELTVFVEYPSTEGIGVGQMPGARSDNSEGFV